jgi:hypothetical protein
MSRNALPPTKPSCRIESVAVGSLILTFESEHFYRGRRYYWTICAARKPEELLLWGHQPSRALAEFAARTALEKLGELRTN